MMGSHNSSGCMWGKPDRDTPTAMHITLLGSQPMDKAREHPLERTATINPAQQRICISAGSAASQTLRIQRQATATFTQWIGGSESNRQSHFSPPSRPIQS